MKYLALVALVVAGYSSAQVPEWPDEREAAYVVYNDGVIRYIPKDYEVVIQPEGWNTAPLNWKTNPLGVFNNRWPLLDALCKPFPQFSTGGPVEDTPEVCEQPNYVVRK